ncbi:hypothetical protein GCM10023205_61410 [Yinghuangia aomiensis]|uniref:DNA primase/polymerase bifunctional N-terminal domain-containing protein n=1 Tax=Yinghuangia aomiensis TaxID=676205 RepID=A0ABP9I0F7_9ACTN
MTKRHITRAPSVSGGPPRWLTAAADDPAEVRAHWRDEPSEPRLLSTGRTFDAVVVSDDLGVRTLEGYRAFAAPPLPTVIDHRTRKVAFLIAPHGLDFWAATIGYLRGEPSYRYLGEGDFVLVPGAAPEVGARLQWLCPPTARPELNAGAIVMLAGHLVAASRRLAREAMQHAE